MHALDLGCTCREESEGHAKAGPLLPSGAPLPVQLTTRNCVRANYEVQTDLPVADYPASIEPFVSRLMQARKGLSGSPRTCSLGQVWTASLKTILRD